jgi:hypothetical protein
VLSALGSRLFSVDAATTSTNRSINVTATVPAQQDSGTSGCQTPPADNPPVITNVASSTAQTTATITWSATDNGSIPTSTFQYGLTTSYGSSVLVTGN